VQLDRVLASLAPLFELSKPHAADADAAGPSSRGVAGSGEEGDGQPLGQGHAVVAQLGVECAERALELAQEALSTAGGGEEEVEGKGEQAVAEIQAEGEGG
jgi:hypothetical protein